MKALIVYYSITGRNEQLARGVKEEFDKRGHSTTIHGLKTVVPVSELAGALMSALRRPARIVDPPTVEESDILVLIGPVWASTICPPVRAFLDTVPHLDGKTVINLVIGHGSYEGLARKMKHLFRDRQARTVISRALRLKDTDSRDKITALSEELAHGALP